MAGKEASFRIIAAGGAVLAALSVAACTGSDGRSGGPDTSASSSASAFPTGEPTPSSAEPVAPTPSPESSVYTAQPASYFVTNASSELGKQIVVGPLDETDLEPSTTVVPVAYPGQKPENEYVDVIVNPQTGASVEAFVPPSMQPDVIDAAKGVPPALYLQGRVGLSDGYPIFSATQSLFPTSSGITTAAKINQMPGPHPTGHVRRDAAFKERRTRPQL